MNFSDYRLEDEGLVICEPCLDFVFFSHAEISAAEPPDILAPYRVFLEHFGTRVSYCRTDGNQMHAKKITESDLGKPALWLGDQKKRVRPELDMELRTGRSRDEWRAPCFALTHSKFDPHLTCCQASVPLEDYAQWGLDGVLDYLSRSLAGFPLTSGYVGYSFAWNGAKPKVEDMVEPFFNRWLQRHPGIMTPNHYSQARLSHLGLTDLGWITLLGPEYAERMGGIDGLRQALAPVPGIIVSALGETVAIRIGDAPRLGDLMVDDALPDYQAVGRVLAPLRNRDILHRQLVIPGVYSKHSKVIQSRWIDRFFPE